MLHACNPERSAAHLTVQGHELRLQGVGLPLELVQCLSEPLLRPLRGLYLGSIASSNLATNPLQTT